MTRYAFHGTLDAPSAHAEGYCLVTDLNTFLQAGPDDNVIFYVADDDDEDAHHVPKGYITFHSCEER